MTTCEECGAALKVGDFPFCKGDQTKHVSTRYAHSGIFPFEVPHVDGKPMKIESLHHLRQVEKTYGVVFSAFSHASANNPDNIKNPPRYRGDDPDVKRQRREY